jgi:hypothetical protein
MLYRDCTGKKVVPTIARGAKQGEGGKNLAPHFRHGASSSAGQAALPAAADFRRENTDANGLFEHQLSPAAGQRKNAVKNTGDRDHFLSYAITDLAAPTIPSVSCPTVKGDDGWATE